VSQRVLDVVAEDPQEEHVSGEMQKAGMEEHARYQRQERDFKAGVPRKEGRKTGWDRGIRKEQGVEGTMRNRGFKTHLIEKYNDVGENQCDIHEGISARGIEVLEGDEHRLRSAAE